MNSRNLIILLAATMLAGLVISGCSKGPDNTPPKEDATMAAQRRLKKGD